MVLHNFDFEKRQTYYPCLFSFPSIELYFNCLGKKVCVFHEGESEREGLITLFWSEKLEKRKKILTY